MLSGEIALKNNHYYYYYRLIDLRINNRTMRIVKKDIHKQSERKDMSGATYRANDNSPASL